MSVDLDHIRQVMKEADCLYNEQQIEEAIATMARDITSELADTTPLVLCVMNGGLVITGKLLTRMQFPLEASYVPRYPLPGPTHRLRVGMEGSPDAEH